MKSYQYTLCFIKRADEILLLNRNKHPWIGRWTGVGGRLEEEESPVECILREVLEETGIKLSDVKDCGVVTWEVDGGPLGGMHIYLSDVADDFIYNTPRFEEEGIVDWKNINWIMNPKNSGIVENIPKFLPCMIDEQKRYHHHCVFENEVMVEIKSNTINKIT